MYIDTVCESAHSLPPSIGCVQTRKSTFKVVYIQQCPCRAKKPYQFTTAPPPPNLPPPHHLSFPRPPPQKPLNELPQPPPTSKKPASFCGQRFVFCDHHHFFPLPITEARPGCNPETGRGFAGAEGDSVHERERGRERERGERRRERGK